MSARRWVPTSASCHAPFVATDGYAPAAMSIGILFPLVSFLHPRFGFCSCMFSARRAQVTQGVVLYAQSLWYPTPAARTVYLPALSLAVGPPVLTSLGVAKRRGHAKRRGLRGRNDICHLHHAPMCAPACPVYDEPLNTKGLWASLVAIFGSGSPTGLSGWRCGTGEAITEPAAEGGSENGGPPGPGTVMCRLGLRLSSMLS